jgi:hypothetical protein
MSKRIVYQRNVYERVASSPSFDARLRSVAQDVLELSRTMGQDSLQPTRDNIMEVLALIRDHLFQRVPRVR